MCLPKFCVSIDLYALKVIFDFTCYYSYDRKDFSIMNITKNSLRNRMEDTWMNDCLVTYIEKNIFREVQNEKIVNRYQNMKTRHEQL